MTNHTPIQRRIIRRKQIPEIYGVTLSSFDKGVRRGIYPRGFKLGPPPMRAVGWYSDVLDECFERLATEQSEA